jgi:flavin-dependent dehydrogenase
MTESFDVAIVGAGPAGSLLARRLAQLSKRVVLIEKTGEFQRCPGESLTLGVLPLLEAAGLRERVEAAWCLRPRIARILWAGEWRNEGTSSFIVDRPRFNQVLVDAAREAGVQVIRPAHVACCTFAGDWVVRLDDGRQLRAGFLADASGRSCLLPGRKIQYGARTFALCGYLSGTGESIRDTVVEASQSVWYWGAPLGDGTFSAMAFVDACDARPQRYTELIEQSLLLGPLLRTARCIQRKACDATSFLDIAPIDEHSIKVGDAAVSVDPLASQGIQIAIGTALHGAAVINTMLDRPSDRDVAMDFYRQRVTQSADFHSASAATFYRQQFEAHPTDFWRRRANWPIRLGAKTRRRHNDPPAQGISVCVSSHARLVRLGASDGRHIFPEDAVELNGNAVAYVGGVKWRDLLESLRDPTSVDELIGRWAASIPIEKAHQIFRWAWAEKWIERADRT